MHVAQTQRVSLVHGICSDIQDFKTLSHPAGASQPDRPAFPLGTVLIPRTALQGKFLDCHLPGRIVYTG